MYKDGIIKTMPKVGEKRMEVPVASGLDKAPGPPQSCTVVEVHPAHLWYRVRFDKTGHCECYKAPNFDPQSRKRSGQ